MTGKRGSSPDGLIVGLDVGTANIKVVVGEPTEDSINIIGVGSHPSKGLRKGLIVNIEATVAGIKRAVEEAELMAGCDIASVVVGIGGGHLQSLNSPGVIAVKGREVTPEDMTRVIDAAQAVAIPTDREVIHTLPQEYSVDEQDGIQDPSGMTGVRLEARVHIVTGQATAVQNLVKCCNRAGLDVSEIVLQSLASAEAVLTPDERELGVLMLDVGAGTLDAVLYSGGAVRHTWVLPLGGNNLTKDLAIGLRTPDAAAEKIKKRHGTTLVSRVGRDQVIDVPSTGGREPRVLSRQIMAEIMEARAEEILSLAEKEMSRLGLLEQASAGLVLTGGSAVVDGLTALAEQVFDLPTRLGDPIGFRGLTDVVSDPAFSAATGLVLHAHRRKDESAYKPTERPSGVGDVVGRLKNWFKEVF